MTPVMKQQIVLNQQRMEEYGMLVGPAPSRLFSLIPQTLAWFNRISSLTYVYWIDKSDESVASTLEALISGLLNKTMPFNSSRVISFYFQHSKIYQPLASYLDFLLQDLVLPMNADIDILQEAMIFMLSFIMDPPNVDSEDREMIWGQIYATVNKFSSLIHSISFDVANQEISKAHFSDFMMKVDGLKAKVRELFLVIPYSLQCPSPTTNVISFFDILILNLRRMLKSEMHLIPFLKNLCESLLIELLSFQPLLKSIMQLLYDGKHGEILNLPSEIGNMVYNADYISKLCFLRRIYVWYGMIALPEVIEHIKFIKIEINKLHRVEKMYEKTLNHHDQMEETDVLRARGTPSKIETVSIGFRKIEGLIINDLTRGQTSLTIISISRSGGQGKTTLAKRIYDDANVRCRFQKSVWCYVSKDFLVKELLVQILYGKNEVGGAVESEVQDLIERVWKSLKGRRFLIVLDDIWDMDSWGHLESLFPDDKNGSRILFTSRNHDLASQVKPNSISHPLPLFSDEESWELMMKSVFNPNECDKKFVGIGKQIASYCKGLPLAVALIAGVLGRTKHNLDSWNKVAENLKAHLAQEGCGNVLELSYRYLPDHLKSCFLYFAVFRRGEEVNAHILKLLWIGEGFVIQDGGSEFSKKHLATKYLKDLVSQGLAVVTELSSVGGIKKCNVHDLLYDLCLEKAKEDNFLHWTESSVLFRDDEWNIDSSSRPLKYNHHRLRIGESDPLIKSWPNLAERELPTSSLHSFLWSTYYSEVRESSLWFLESFKILTVLKLRLEVNNFPEVILSSISLRYLELDFLRGIRNIPPAIANLWRLDTLIIGNCTFVFTLLPLPMWGMEILRYVDCNFARLDLEGFDSQTSSKSNIETLGTVRLDEDDSTTAEILRRFPNLRKLKCQTCNREWHILELLSMVGSLLIQLESLQFSHFGYYNEYPKSIVRDFATNENLTKLSLYCTHIPWSVLSKIGKQLPKLLVLKLLLASCIGSIWKLEDGDFSNLLYLRLSNVCIEEIDISSCEDPLPCLEHLVLEYCWELMEIPTVLGEINTLKSIRVSNVSKELKTSAMKILEEQREFGNDTLQVIAK